MRIFFDTNVLIAAYLWKGVARHVFEVAITDHTPVVSEDVIEEAKRVLSRKFDYLAEELGAFEVSIREQCEVVPTPTRLPEVAVRDSDDAWILAAASAADILITRDKDLLDIADAVTVPRIARPEDFQDVLPDAP